MDILNYYKKESTLLLIGVTVYVLGNVVLEVLLKMCRKIEMNKVKLMENKNENEEFSTIKADYGLEKDLLREQLKRNYEFFSDGKMENIKNTFVCVVGIGGVGSHAVMTLIRSGVQKIRVIDYDTVSLSSLNRHAFAMRKDVGRLKVEVVKDYAAKVFPLTTIEAIDDAITTSTKDKYLSGVDYVIDCIDDLDNKCFLLRTCIEKKIKVISSMGAGARTNPFLTRIADFTEIKGDTVAKRLRYSYRKKFKEDIPEGVKCVFSIENPKRGLSELEEHQKENKQDYQVNTNERIRTLPVFASIPAIFGQSLAAVCLCDLAEEDKFEEYSEKKENEEKEKDFIGEYPLKKLIKDFKEWYLSDNKNDTNKKDDKEIKKELYDSSIVNHRVDEK